MENWYLYCCHHCRYHFTLYDRLIVSYGNFVVLAFKVLEKMEATGWTQRSGVRVYRGRWQDVVPRLESEIAEGRLEPFDGVFFDTYAEDDRDLSQFHHHLPRIMSQYPNARYSYYNGMCPDSVFFHGVACETTRLRLERFVETLLFLVLRQASRKNIEPCQFFLLPVVHVARGV